MSEEIKRQQVPHNFLFCDLDHQPCFWRECLARGCMATVEAHAKEKLQSDVA